MLVSSKESPIDTSVEVFELKSKWDFPGLACKMIELEPVKKFVRDKF